MNQLAAAPLVALLLVACSDAPSSQPTRSTPATSVAPAIAPVTPPAPTTTAFPVATSAPPDGSLLPPPFDCDTTLDGTELVAGDPAPVDEIEANLPLMIDLYDDAILIWEQFDVMPDQLMVDGQPRMLMPVDEVAGRCAEIIEAVAHPGLVAVVDYSEEVYSVLSEQGSPPWRRLIESEIGTFRSSEEERRWSEMGTGAHGVTRIKLEPGEDELAASLAERFGPLVDVSIGNFPFDPATGSIVGEDLCTDVPVENVRDGVLAWDVRRSSEPRHRIIAEIVNGNEAPVHIIPARVVELTLPDSNRTVTAFTGALTAEARESLQVDKGGLTVVAADLSFAPCDPTLGSELPPGTYDAAFVIEVYDEPANEGDREPDEFLVARMPIDIP